MNSKPAQAMILAAGRGERMRPLTDTCPKPLLPVRGKPLMQWPMAALSRGGFDSMVINTAWLGEKIEGHFGTNPSNLLCSSLSDSEQPPDADKSVHITYSHEGQDFGGALETAGGIARALPLLDDIFWVVAGDVYVPDFAFTQAAVTHFAASGKLGHIWLVPNPPHNPRGDFGLSPQGLALNLARDSANVRHTFSTIGLYRKALFAAPWCNIAPGNPQGVKAPLAPLLRAAMDNAQITAELYPGPWTDVGTPERLRQLNTP